MYTSDDYRLLNEDEIQYLCEVILERERNISVGKTIMRYARLNVDTTLFRRVHTNLLESDKYQETPEVDKYGLNRIRYAPKKPWKDRYWFLIAVFTYVLGLVTPILTNRVQTKFQGTTKEQSKQTVLLKKDSVSYNQ